MTSIVAYHGTTAHFEQFEVGCAGVSGSSTSSLGGFFSTDPAIAAHFTLKPDVVDAGYDSAAGSRSLLSHPGRYDPMPFLDHARVAEVELVLERPYLMSAQAWADWVDDIHGIMTDPEADVKAFRQHLLDQGHDGIQIEAWDGQRAADGTAPSVETDAVSFVVFNREQVTLKGWRPADQYLPAFPKSDAPRRGHRP